MRIPFFTGAANRWATKRMMGMRSDSLLTEQLLGQVRASSSGDWDRSSSTVTTDTGWVFAGQRQIGGRGARVPISLHRVSPSSSNGKTYLQRGHVEGRVLVHEHPFLDLIAHPNPEESGLVFHWRQLNLLNSRGACYVLVVPEVFDLDQGPDGEPMVLSRIKMMRILDTTRVTPKSSDGRLIGEYEYRGASHGIQTWAAAPATPEQRRRWLRDPKPFVFRIVFPDGDHILGASPNVAAQAPIKTLLALGEFNNNQLRNGVHAGMIIYMLTSEEDPQRYHNLVMLLKAGIGKAGEPLILPQKRFKVEQSPAVKQEMQFEKMSDRARQESLGVIGASDSMVGLSKEVNRSTIWGMEHLLATGTVDPLNGLIVDAYNAFLLPLYPGQSRSTYFVADFKSSRLVDEKDDAEIMRGLVTDGILTPNEVRAELGKAPHEDGNDLRAKELPAVNPATAVSDTPGQAAVTEEEATAK